MAVGGSKGAGVDSGFGVEAWGVRSRVVESWPEFMLQADMVSRSAGNGGEAAAVDGTRKPRGGAGSKCEFELGIGGKAGVSHGDACVVKEHSSRKYRLGSVTTVVGGQTESLCKARRCCR